MEFNEGDTKVRDPFQTELLDAVKKRSSRVLDENYNFDTTQLLNEFDPQLNSKMSKYQSKLMDPEQHKTVIKDYSDIEPKTMFESEINFAESKGLNSELRNDNGYGRSTQDSLLSLETEEKAIDRKVSRHKKEYGEQRRSTVRLENELEQLFSSSNPTYSKDIENQERNDYNQSRSGVTEENLSFKPKLDTAIDKVTTDAHPKLKENEQNITSPVESPRRPKPRPRSTIIKNSELDKTYSKETNPKELDFLKSTPKRTSTPSLFDSLMDDEKTQRMRAEREVPELQYERKAISTNFQQNQGASKWNEREDETIKKSDKLKRQTSMKTTRSTLNDSTRTLELKQRSEKDKTKSAEKLRTTKNGTLRRSSSLTNISNIQPKSLNDLNASGSTRQNALTIRERVYYEWLHNKTSKSKEETKGLSEKAKLEEKEKEEEKIQKKIMAENTFNAWSQTKGVKIKEKKQSIKATKLQEKEEEDEKLQKKLDGNKFFESWKQRKDEVVKEQFKKKQRAARRRKEDEEREQKEKKVTAQKVFENWKSKKEETLQNSIEAKTKKQKEERLVRMAEHEKKKEAEKAYDSWKNHKELSPRQPKSPSLTQRSWRPNGTRTRNVIPEKVQPVVLRPNHKRTLSASGRLQINNQSQR